jgi:hypothetical protein
VADIQSKFDAVFRLQQNNEMGTERFALYFWPGVYGSPSEPLMLQIGYYTDVAGLGATPDETVIYGKVEVYNRCFEPDPYDEGKFIPTADSENGLCFALNSFWRSMSNLQVSIVTPAYQDQCRATAMFWAISQASSMRRVHVANGDMSLMDYCSSKWCGMRVCLFVCLFLPALARSLARSDRKEYPHLAYFSLFTKTQIRNRPCVRKRRVHRRFEGRKDHFRIAATVLDKELRRRSRVGRVRVESDVRRRHWQRP